MHRPGCPPRSLSRGGSYTNSALFQFNKYRRIELAIVEPIACFFPPDYDKRLDPVRVQFFSAVQDRRAALSVGHLKRGWFVVDLDRQTHPGRRQSPVFEKHHGVGDLSLRHYSGLVPTCDEEYAGRKQDSVWTNHLLELHFRDFVVRREPFPEILDVHQLADLDLPLSVRIDVRSALHPLDRLFQRLHL